MADTGEKAVAYAAGMLSERVKGHEEMFVSPGVRWGLDAGEMDLADVTMLFGTVLGAFDLIRQGGRPRLVWTPR